MTGKTRHGRHGRVRDVMDPVRDALVKTYVTSQSVAMPRRYAGFDPFSSYPRAHDLECVIFFREMFLSLSMVNRDSANSRSVIVPK